jgi:hypothetical protein
VKTTGATSRRLRGTPTRFRHTRRGLASVAQPARS